MKKLSEKQLAANRANATHSTGPRTVDGKARAAQNARTHGLSAATIGILRIEDCEVIDRILAETVAAYQPVNSEELFAVRRIAVCKVALVRAACLEAGMFTRGLNEALNHDNLTPIAPLHPELIDDRLTMVGQTRNYVLADGFQRMARAGNSWVLFFRYQAQTERLYRRAVEDFERLRRLRHEIPNEPNSAPQPEENTPLAPSPKEPIPTPATAPASRTPAPDPGPVAPAPASRPPAPKPRARC